MAKRFKVTERKKELLNIELEKLKQNNRKRRGQDILTTKEVRKMIKDVRYRTDADFLLKVLRRYNKSNAMDIVKSRTGQIPRWMREVRKVVQKEEDNGAVMQQRVKERFGSIAVSDAHGTEHEAFYLGNETNNNIPHRDYYSYDNTKLRDRLISGIKLNLFGDLERKKEQFKTNYINAMRRNAIGDNSLYNYIKSINATDFFNFIRDNSHRVDISFHYTEDDRKALESDLRSLLAINFITEDRED